MRALIAIGERYGRLLVVGHRVEGWVCECDCGGQPKPVSATSLRKGRVVSCGCLGSERRLAAARTHGQSYSRLYNVWRSMKSRCDSPAAAGYENYGGRGIRVCDRWRKTFEAFASDVGELPPGMSIDRKDVNGNYEPGNVRWATNEEQCQNTRRTRLTPDIVRSIRAQVAAGRTTTSLAEELGINPSHCWRVAVGQKWSNVR